MTCASSAPLPGVAVIVTTSRTDMIPSSVVERLRVVPRTPLAPRARDEDFHHVEAGRRRRHDAERYRQRVARAQIGAGGGLQLFLGLVGKSFKSSGRIVAADDERFRWSWCVWERRPDGERDARLEIEGDDVRASVVNSGLHFPALGLHEPLGFVLPLGSAQTKDAIRVALADDTLLRSHARRRCDNPP